MSKFPSRFIERIHEILPKDEWDDFFAHATKPLSKTIRISKSKIDNRKSKTPSAWKLTSTSIPEAFFIQRENQTELPLGRTLEHFSGRIYIASLSSLLSVHVLDPKPEEKILDVAAAPGSKSTFIADRMKNTGVLVVNEPSSSRSMKLASNLDRMGVENEVLLQSDGTYLNTFFVQEFDRILIDAPCSSEGFGRKDSTFFEKMWSEKKIFEAAKLQKKLIKASFEMLSPGGTMVYSTCTSAPEENEAVVQYLINTFGEHVEILPIDLGTIPHKAGIKKFGTDMFDSAIVKNVRRIFPHLRSDTWNSEIFFIAKIRKTNPLSLVKTKTSPLKSSTQILGKNQSATIIAKLCKKFGFDREIFEKKIILERNDTLFLTTKTAAQFAIHHPYRRAGLPMIDKHENIMSPFAIHYGSLATTNRIELTTEEKERWLEGFDIPLSKPLEKNDGTEIFVQYEGFCLGHGKVLNKGKKLKNKLDRNLVF